MIKKKVDEVTQTISAYQPGASKAPFLIPIGMVRRGTAGGDFMSFIQSNLTKKKRKPHPLINWDELMKDYPNSLIWYL